MSMMLTCLCTHARCALRRSSFSSQRRPWALCFRSSSLAGGGATACWRAWRGLWVQARYCCRALTWAVHAGLKLRAPRKGGGGQCGDFRAVPSVHPHTDPAQRSDVILPP
jgi:hypothetical protein